MQDVQKQLYSRRHHAHSHRLGREETATRLWVKEELVHMLFSSGKTRLKRHRWQLNISANACLFVEFIYCFLVCFLVEKLSHLTGNTWMTWWEQWMIKWSGRLNCVTPFFLCVQHYGFTRLMMNATTLVPQYILIIMTIKRSMTKLFQKSEANGITVVWCDCTVYTYVSRASNLTNWPYFLGYCIMLIWLDVKYIHVWIKNQLL